MPLAVSVARQFTTPYISAADVRQEALVALVMAARTFSPDRGPPFGEYARACILNHLRSQLAEAGNLLRLPRRAEKVRRKIAAARQRLQAEGTPHPTWEQLAEATGLTVRQVAMFPEWSAGDARPDAFGLAESRDDDQVEALEAALGNLDPDDRHLLERLHGLGGRPAETARAIAQSEGCIPATVAARADRARSRLRGALTQSVGSTV
jgi:RNA polymerase sigma factor (sigma-70 family)